MKSHAELRAPAEAGRDVPLTSVLLGLVGGALVASRRRWPNESRSAATVAGLALIGAAAHRPVVEAVLRAGTRRRSAEVKMSFIVAQPVERVFGFCRDFEHFPRFIGALREVRDYGDGRSHWCASTPGGKTVEWDTVITKYVPNSVIGWRSTGNAAVDSSGLLRFHPEDEGTCVHVVLAYRVRRGTMGDAIAALTSPARSGQLEADVRRLAEFLENATDRQLADLNV